MVVRWNDQRAVEYDTTSLCSLPVSLPLAGRVRPTLLRRSEASASRRREGGGGGCFEATAPIRLASLATFPTRGKDKSAR